MSEKIYLCLFIFCVILCEGIFGDFSEDAGESNSLVRRKRVINLEPNGDVPLQNGVAPFVVNIREAPTNFTICVGSILSKRTVITTAICVDRINIEVIKVLVGSSYSHRGLSHDVIQKKIYFGRYDVLRTDGVALLIVEPAINFGAYTASIGLHVGPLLPGTRATILGWGCNPTAPRGTVYLKRLRFITLPIMRHQDCVNAFRNRLEITDKDICTYDPNKRCGHTDLGAPLVVDNELAGVHIRRTVTRGHINPDIYAMLQHQEYAQWIRNNIVHNL